MSVVMVSSKMPDFIFAGELPRPAEAPDALVFGDVPAVKGREEMRCNTLG
jgi:hypothetical protein